MIDAWQPGAQMIVPVSIAGVHSSAMYDDHKIDDANDLAPAIVEACTENPLAEHKGRFRIIGFIGQAEVAPPVSRGTEQWFSSLLENGFFSASLPFRPALEGSNHPKFDCDLEVGDDDAFLLGMGSER